MTLVAAVAIAVLTGCGVYLLLQRQLTRVVLGFALLGHGANLVLLTAGGRAGAPAFVDGGAAPVPDPGTGGGPVDPLPQALALTAIVISFGVVAFLLSVAYRSWVLHREDLVADDREDRRIARLARGDELAAAAGMAADGRLAGGRAAGAPDPPEARG